MNYIRKEFSVDDGIVKVEEPAVNAAVVDVVDGFDEEDDDLMPTPLDDFDYELSKRADECMSEERIPFEKVLEKYGYTVLYE